MPRESPTPAPALVRRPTVELWTDFDRVFADLDRRFSDAFGVTAWTPAFVAPSASDGSFWKSAPTDVQDTGKAFQIRAELPGIAKDQLDIRVKGSSVEIRGQSQTKSEETSPEYLHRERRYEGFYRSLELPEPVVAAEAKAKLENGVLELELPKQTPTPSPAEVKVEVH